MTAPDVIVVMTDEERASPSYEGAELRRWREKLLPGRRWFAEHGVSFDRHYTGSLACVPSRPTLFTGHYPDVHGVTQTDGLGKDASDARMRWLRPGEVPTLGHWFRAAGYDTHYDGKWHMSHADLIDPATDVPLATNTAGGEVLAGTVRAYLDADPLSPFGFSGWVGPEPHGPLLANCGVVRDPLIADRVVAWLEDRYARRRAGESDAQRPFLLVASFVNPHDIVLFPAWRRPGNNPLEPGEADPPPVPEPPTRHENLSTKPAAQVAYKHSYYSGYGPSRVVARIYEGNEQAYRDLYYRLHLEVDTPLDRVRRAVTEGGSKEAVLFRTADHGELLGAHGGLHQKWFTLYDEATRVPFQVVRIGEVPTTAATVADVPTSHVDLVPTALAMAGLDQRALAKRLAPSFTEFHPLPGRDLSPLVDGGPDAGELANRAIYMLTRDNVMEGDTLASGLARRIGRVSNPPRPMRIRVPAHVGSNFEGIVTRVPPEQAVGGAGHLWKLNRVFDDPDTWTQPRVSHLAASGPAGNAYRTVPIPDQFELYDLDADPTEEHNRWGDPAAADVFARLRQRLIDTASARVPERNNPWPYARRNPPVEQITRKRPPPPARLLRRMVRSLGIHPDDPEPFVGRLVGRRALIVCTNHAWLDVGRPTGLFASEMTVPYYLFSEAGIDVDLASPLGGMIAVDPLSFRSVVRTHHDDRFLVDDQLRAKVVRSLAVADLDIGAYDIVYFAGGWGAAFDLGFSDAIGEKVTQANAAGKVIGGVCHGPLGLLRATGTDGRPLVEGRRVSAVTDKQVRELGIETTPHHPETELRLLGADFRCRHRRRDPLANHWEVDGNLVTGQNQNAGPMVAREMMKLLAAEGDRSIT